MAKIPAGEMETKVFFDPHLAYSEDESKRKFVEFDDSSKDPEVNQIRQWLRVPVCVFDSTGKYVDTELIMSYTEIKQVFAESQKIAEDRGWNE